MNNTYMNNFIRGVFFFATLFVLQSVSNAYAEDFPLRKRYLDIPTIETDMLKSFYDSTIIIDVRSAFEFGVIHMERARNIPLADISQNDLTKIRESFSDKAIVFYCNGITCAKSYKATRKAISLGLNNVYAYDAGIESWAKAVPEKTFILGRKQNEKSIKALLIPKNQFHSVLIPPEKFIEKSKTGNYFVVDVRESESRNFSPIDLNGIQNIPLNQLLVKLGAGEFPKKNILVLDNVGKQVRWLQYYFNHYGIKNYYFLDGGVSKWKKDGFNQKGEN